ncbi:MAG: sulfoxide reductase heme-binding subunit YedZ [Gemmatimonadetes bacterium]|nr:sulfoxide reductase heme-binding subunit YedZ [Gemmatimonadota bacterium]
MTRSQFIRFVAEPAVFAAALVPAGLIAWQGFHGGLGAEPIREIQLRTGWWALTFLMITLCVTPLRRIPGWNDVIKLRRMLGLFAFFYAMLHFSNYIGIDQFFAWSEITKDILKRPWITVGFVAVTLLVPLAATSNGFMIRKLGRRWGALHRLVYVSGALGVLHFLWLVKKDTREPITFAFILVGLLALRLRRRAPKSAKPRTEGATPREPATASG